MKRCDATRLSRSVSVSLSLSVAIAVAVSVPISVFGRTVRWSLVSGLFASLDSLLSFVSLAVSVSVSVSAVAVVVAGCGLVLVFPLRVQKYLKSNNYMCSLCVRSAMAALLLRFFSCICC